MKHSEPNWWKNLAAGRCFVTNGPLLEVRANGELPGAELTPGEIKLEIALTTLDRVPMIEVVYNGQVVESIVTKGGANQRNYSLTFKPPGDG